MPRPKRSKLVHTVPTKVRVAAPTITSTASKQDGKFSPQTCRRPTNGSDDSDGLVRREKVESSARVRGTQEYTMSGALVQDPAESTRSRPPSGQSRAVLSRIVREADHAQTVVAGNARNARRGKAQLAQATGPSQISSSQPSKSPTVGRQGPGRLGHFAENSGDGSSLGAGRRGTPLAQSSMLGGIQFNRRARQPSLLQLAQAQHDALEDFEDVELYDFRPDDESTPLIKSLSHSRGQRTSSSSGTRKRKLSTPEIQVHASQSQDQCSSAPSDQSQPLQEGDSFDLPLNEDNDLPEPTLPQLRHSTTPSPQIFSDTLAPPQSSSSPIRLSPQTVRGRRKKPAATARAGARDQRKQASPDPSLQATTAASQVTPVRKARPPPKPLTTASLQNLLPRRRTRPKPQSTYDIPSSSDTELDATNLGEDEDELSFYAASKMRRKKLTASTSKRGRKNRGKENSELASKGKRVSKTYARKSIVESHNDDDGSSSGSVDEDTSHEIDGKTGTAPVLDAKAKAEMKRLADKFKEVDEYILEFEDMTGSSSQLRDGR
ncbi:MAG: hypothetical protein Q9217_001358 [Psora testacea]